MRFIRKNQQAYAFFNGSKHSITINQSNKQNKNKKCYISNDKAQQLSCKTQLQQSELMLQNLYDQQHHHYQVKAMKLILQIISQDFAKIQRQEDVGNLQFLTKFKIQKYLEWLNAGLECQDCGQDLVSFLISKYEWLIECIWFEERKERLTFNTFYQFYNIMKQLYGWLKKKGKLNQFYKRTTSNIKNEKSQITQFVALDKIKLQIIFQLLKIQFQSVKSQSINHFCLFYEYYKGNKLFKLFLIELLNQNNALFSLGPQFQAWIKGQFFNNPSLSSHNFHKSQRKIIEQFIISLKKKSIVKTSKEEKEINNLSIIQKDQKQLKIAEITLREQPQSANSQIKCNKQPSMSKQIQQFPKTIQKVLAQLQNKDYKSKQQLQQYLKIAQNYKIINSRSSNHQQIIQKMFHLTIQFPQLVESTIQSGLYFLSIDKFVSTVNNILMNCHLPSKNKYKEILTLRLKNSPAVLSQINYY